MSSLGNWRKPMPPTRSQQVADIVKTPDPDTTADHFNYDALVDCGCWLCRGQRQLEAEAEATLLPVADHVYRCPCTGCAASRKAKTRLIAHANKRDAYSELSFVSQDRSWAPLLLAWMLSRVRDPTTKEWWWAYRAERTTIGAWISSWFEDIGAGQLKEMAVARGTLACER